MNKAAIVVVLQAVIALTPACALAEANEEVKVADSRDVSLTVYNQDFGLVKDIRTITLNNGINYLRMEDVAAQIDPTSVSFTSVTAPNTVAVREQNYQYDLMDPDTILSKSVGKTVKFKQISPSGAVSEITGVLLNAPSATVVDTDGNVTVKSQGLV